jgi:predicted nucleic acid-binding protein
MSWKKQGYLFTSTVNVIVNECTGFYYNEDEAMRKLKIYLDTSAIGYLDEQTSPSEMSDMLALWKEIEEGKFDVVISDVTLAELTDNRNNAKVEMQMRFLAAIEYDIVRVSDEVLNIASLVKSTGILVSDRHQNDRLHIGCAVVSGCDVLVSSNFKNLANIRTIKGVRGISILSGYGNVNMDIVPAAMLIEEEEG